MCRSMRCVCLAIAIVGAPRVSNAQEQNPQSIPTELVLALFDRGDYDSGRRATRIIVGRAPDGMPQSLTSFDGGTVLGGARLAQNAVVVIAFTLPPNQILLSVDRQLRARGWTSPPPPPDANRGGFVSSNGFGSPFGTTYCADSSGIALTSMPAPSGGSYIKITQLRNQQFNFCIPRQRDRIFPGMELTFPTLQPPPGMISHGGGSGMGGNSSMISARLTGPLKPADLIAHYRSQLDAAGWRTRTPVTTGEDAALAYVETTDPTGVVWRGVMTSVRSAPSDVEVEIKMFKPDR